MSYGRVKIHSDAKEITIDNVAREVGRAFALHSKNRIKSSRLPSFHSTPGGSQTVTLCTLDMSKGRKTTSYQVDPK